MEWVRDSNNSKLIGRRANYPLQGLKQQSSNSPIHRFTDSPTHRSSIPLHNLALPLTPAASNTPIRLRQYVIFWPR